MSHSFSGIPASKEIKTVDNTVIGSWQDCADFMRRGGPEREYDLIGSNVHIVKEIGEVEGEVTYAVELYDTKVIRYWPDETFSVDNGGFNTMTTAIRINQFTPRWFRCWHDKKKLRGTGSTGELTHDVRLPVSHNPMTPKSAA